MGWETWNWELLKPLDESIQVHLALDEVLLSRVAARSRPPTLRFWNWAAPALVLGSHQSIANEVHLDAARELGYEVVRRMSGGGTMVAVPDGVITWSLYAPVSLVERMSFIDSFRFLDAWVVDGLVKLGIPASYRPVNEVISPEGKIGGAAQARRRGAVLHHAILTHHLDPSLIPRLIRIGEPSLSPVGIRSAERIVSPLSRFTSLTRDQIVEHLLATFAAVKPSKPGAISESELAEARDLAASKYSRRDWIERLP